MMQRILGVLLLFLFLPHTMVYAEEAKKTELKIDTTTLGGISIKEEIFSADNTTKISTIITDKKQNEVLVNIDKLSQNMKATRDMIIKDSSIKEVVIDGTTYPRDQAVGILDRYSTKADDIKYTITNFTPQILENAKANNKIQDDAATRMGTLSVLKDDYRTLKTNISNETAYNNKLNELAKEKFPIIPQENINKLPVNEQAKANEQNTKNNVQQANFIKAGKSLTDPTIQKKFFDDALEYTNAKQSLKNLENNITTNRQFKENYTKETNRTWSLGMLPGFEGNIYDFFNKIIRASVSISMTLAVLMLVLAGFAAVQAKDSAKEDYFTKVRNISSGIALILLSYMIIAAVYALFYSL